MRPMSLSKRSVFKACPRQYCFKHVTPPPNYTPATSKAMTRGLHLHDQLEIAIRDKSYKVFGTEFKHTHWFLNELCEKGLNASVPELEIAYNPMDGELVPWDYRGPVVRAKIDWVFQLASTPKVLYVLDWKTGKIYDKHAEEREFYACLGAEIASKLNITFDFVQTIYFYIDQGSAIPFNYDDQESSYLIKKEDLPAIKERWMSEMVEIGSTERFVYTPGQPQCNWCEFSKAKGGPCEF